MVIFIGNGIGDLSSNPEVDCLRFTFVNALGKGINPSLLLTMGK